jgi:hypothetical protein
LHCCLLKSPWKRQHRKDSECLPFKVLNKKKDCFAFFFFSANNDNLRNKCVIESFLKKLFFVLIKIRVLDIVSYFETFINLVRGQIFGGGCWGVLVLYRGGGRGLPFSARSPVIALNNWAW